MYFKNMSSHPNINILLFTSLLTVLVMAANNKIISYVMALTKNAYIPLEIEIVIAVASGIIGVVIVNLLGKTDFFDW
jgi:hypothetical protein